MREERRPQRTPGQSIRDGEAVPEHILLSDEEAQLVHLVAEGYDLAEIAARLDGDIGAARGRLAALVTRLGAEAGYRSASG